ncbi:MAG: sigma-70 family RNA polymerase sigma factor [Candidatus Aminicenantes bacterium]|jgi:RNA polymerase sigma-70 factor (ECF subfamily)
MHGVRDVQIGMDEQELVRRSQEGDEEAFGALVNKYKIKVFHLAYSLTHNLETADDLAQEVFIKAYLALKKFKGQSEFGTWVYRIAVNHCRDFLRKKSRMSQISFEDIQDKVALRENETSPEDREREDEERKKLIHQAIQTLPEKHRVILSLRDIQGFSYDEITKILNLSPGTVDSRLHRARKKLKNKLEPFFSQKGEGHEM